MPGRALVAAWRPHTLDRHRFPHNWNPKPRLSPVSGAFSFCLATLHFAQGSLMRTLRGAKAMQFTMRQKRNYSARISVDLPTLTAGATSLLPVKIDLDSQPALTRSQTSGSRYAA